MQCHSFVYKRPDQLTDKMSDSDESSDILWDIKLYSFEPLAKKVTVSINCEELAAANAANMRPRSTIRLGLVCICLCWYKLKS